MTDRLLRLVSSDTPSTPVGLSRIVLGVAGCLEVLSTITSHRLDRVLRAGVLEAPRWEWFPRLSQDGGRVFEVGLLLALVLFTVGWRTRLTGGAAFVAVTYYLAMDQQLYANHVYLLAVLLLLFVVANAGAAVSVDALRGRGRPLVPRWPAFLLQAQVAVVYGFAMLSKLNGDWFGGDVLEANMVRIGPFDLPSLLEREGVYVALAVGTVLVEGFLAFAFYVRRLQPAAVVVGLAFHLSIVLTVDRWSPYAAIGFTVFGLEMVALYVVCVGVPERWAQGWPSRKNISNWIPSGSLKRSARHSSSSAGSSTLNPRWSNPARRGSNTSPWLPSCCWTSSTVAVGGWRSTMPCHPSPFERSISTRSSTRDHQAALASASCRDVWPRAGSVIYEEPKRLVALGWATATVERMGRRPSTTYEVAEWDGVTPETGARPPPFQPDG